METAQTHVLGTQTVLDRTCGSRRGRGSVSTWRGDGRHGCLFRRFPFAKGIEFSHEQADWLADDQYCCNPKCSCEEAVLLFIRLPEKVGQEALRPTLSISYQYRDGKVTRLEPVGDPSYSEQSLLESLKKTRADLDSLLAQRQSLLRRLCRRSLKKQTIHSPTFKIGRKDPCPCGSGKKWKRCCGA